MQGIGHISRGGHFFPAALSWRSPKGDAHHNSRPQIFFKFPTYIERKITDKEKKKSGEKIKCKNKNHVCIHLHWSKYHRQKNHLRPVVCCRRRKRHRHCHTRRFCTRENKIKPHHHRSYFAIAYFHSINLANIYILRIGGCQLFRNFMCNATFIQKPFGSGLTGVNGVRRRLVLIQDDIIIYIRVFTVARGYPMQLADKLPSRWKCFPLVAGTYCI